MKTGAAEMVEIQKTEEIQALLYDLTKAFHEICEKHNLYYVAFGGTMLGAVRHQAFIPWDDDIDVCMPRKDYEKFCEIAAEQYADKYVLKKYPQENYIYDYAKFCMKDSRLIEYDLRKKLSELMLYIDVFPVDGYPQPDEEAAHFKKLKHYNKARCNGCYRALITNVWWKKPYAAIKFLKFLPYRIIGPQHFVEKAIEESKKYDFDASEYVSMQGAGWNEKGKLAKETFLNRKLYPFGDIEIWGISDYHEHLTRLYGDYMTPPPEEKRVTNHAYRLYVKTEKDNEG